MAAGGMRRTGLSLGIDGAKEFKETLAEINRKLKLSQAELAKVTNAYGANEKSVETLTAQKNHLNNALEANSEEQRVIRERLQAATEALGENHAEVQKLQVQLANAEAGGVALARQLGEVTAALEEQERAIRGQRWTELGEKMEQAGQRMQAAGKKMSDVGKKMSMAVTAPLLAIGTAALAVGADFQNSMGTVQARTGMAADEVEELGKSFRALALSGEYGTFTAREIASAFSGIAVAGQDAEYGTEIMRTAMVLATATGNNLGATAYFLGNYLLKVGKDASYAEKYVNLFAAANQKTGIGLNTLQNYLFRANVTLQSTNTSGAEATAVFGMLYQAGIRGAQAYSGLENAMRSLLTPTQAQLDALERLGVARHDENGRLRDGIPFMLDVAHALGDLEGAYLAYYNQLLGSTAMGSAFLGGMVDIKDGLPGVIAELYDVSEAVDGTGRAFEMAALQQDGLVGANKQIRASLEEIMLQISDHLLPHVQSFLGAVNVWIQRFASLDESTQRTILKIAGIAAVIGPVLIIGGKLVATAGKITSGFAKMAKAIGAAGGAKAFFTAKVPLLSKATAAYTAANAKLLAAIKGTGVAAAASTKAFGIKAAAMAAFTKISAIVTGGLGAVKAGFVKLKAVMLANPIGLIIAGVAALAAGIVYLISRVRRVSDEYQEMGAETARLAARQNELAEAAANAASQFRQNTSHIQDQGRHFRELADSIEYLSGKQELSSGEMALLERYIAELNDSVPGLTLAIDEQTGAMNMSAEALHAYIRAAEKRAALDAQLEESLRLREEAIELEREMIDVTAQREAVEEKLNDGTRRRRADRKALERQLQELIDAEAGYNAALGANADMQEALAQSIDLYAGALAETERAQVEAADAAKRMAEAMEDAAGSVDGASDAMERHGLTVEEWERKQSRALDKINRAFESYHRIAANAFRTVSEAAAVSVQELTQNLQDNARAVEEWSKNIAVLTERGVDQGLIQQLRDAGPEAAATVRELVQASDEELDALNVAFAESTRVALDSMKRELDPAGAARSAGELIDKVAEAILSNQSMEDALVGQLNSAFGALNDTVATIGFDGAGKNAVDGFTAGIESMQGSVRDAGLDTGASYLDGLEGELEIRSPSRRTRQIAVNAGEGMIGGTQQVMPRVADMARTLARAFVGGIADTISQSREIDNSVQRQVEDMRRIADMAVTNSHFEGVGMEMAKGVARGIQFGGGMVSNAAQNMINSALVSMRQTAAISSPSKKSMEIAERIGEGLIVGMKAKGSELVAVCREITDRVMDSLHIDPSELMESSKGILRNMRTDIPSLQNNIRQATSPAPQQLGAQSRTLVLHIDRPVIREEGDIYRIINAVKKELLRDVDFETRIGGAVLVP